MTSAGRMPCCSLPRPGLKFTSQISPRFGLRASVDCFNAAPQPVFRSLAVLGSHGLIPGSELAPELFLFP